MLWILAYHFRSDTVGIAAMGHPVVAGARSLNGFGRLVADAGYQGVALFVFASGAGLAMSAASRPAPGARSFYGDRARRVLPAYYLSVALSAVVLAALATWSVPHLDRAPYRPGWAAWMASATIAGRLGSATLSQAPPPSAWFVALLLQLYVLFPSLWWLRRRLGAPGMLAVALLATVASRYAVHAVLAGWVDRPGLESFWLSVLAPARLFEFAAGVALGPVLIGRGTRLLAALAPAGVAAWAAGSALEGGRWDAVSTVLVIGGLVPVVAAVSSAVSRLPGAGRALVWVGRRSLEIFLVQDAVRLGLGTWESSGHAVTWGVEPAAGFLGAALVAGAAFGAALDAIQRRVPGLRPPRHGSSGAPAGKMPTVPPETSRRDLVDVRP